MFLSPLYFVLVRTRLPVFVHMCVHVCVRVCARACAPMCMFPCPVTRLVSIRLFCLLIVLSAASCFALQLSSALFFRRVTDVAVTAYPVDVSLGRVVYLGRTAVADRSRCRCRLYCWLRLVLLTCARRRVRPFRSISTATARASISVLYEFVVFGS